MGGGEIGACETTRWEVFFFLKREDVTIFLTFINSIESNSLLNIFIYGTSFKEKKISVEMFIKL